MTLFQDLIDRLTGHRRLTLTETQRMLVLRNGVFDAILGAGKHRLPRKDVLTELHDLEKLFFVSPYERALMQNRPELAARHLTEFRAVHAAGQHDGDRIDEGDQDEQTERCDEQQGPDLLTPCRARQFDL